MSGIPILAPPSIFTSMHARSNNSNVEQQHSHILSCVPADIGSVCVREVGISCPLLSALLAGLRLQQHMLHAFVCFASCNRSDPSVLAAKKSRSQTDSEYWRIPVLKWNKKKQLLKNNGTYSATFTVVILYISPETSITAASPGTAMQLTFNGSMSFNTTPIYQEPPPQV